MKKLSMVLLFGIILLSNLTAGNVTAYLTYAAFNIPDQHPYFETYLSVIGESLQLQKNKEGKYQGAVEIFATFSQQGAIKSAKKYTLWGPETTDTTTQYDNFVDQQRYELAAGEYDLELIISDPNKSNSKPFSTKVSIKIDFPADRITLSDIQLLESFTKSVNPGILTKSGYDLVPYVSTLLPENTDYLKFYAEVYNAKKILGDSQRIIISCYLENFETKAKLSEFGGFSKQEALPVNILLKEFDIKTLPTGSYNLVVEVRDRENKIQAEQKYYVERQGRQKAFSLADLKAIDVSSTFVSSYMNKDTLSEFIRCIRPVSSSSEILFAENQLQSKDLLLMQQFFFNFWRARDPNDPKTAWLNYLIEVQKVNQQFNTFGLKGYDTDRGRVYLQYGPPNSREISTIEPSAYPYELWQYNSLVDKAQIVNVPNNRQSNKRFVFYNPDMVTNKYYLLHSDARGERNNPRWQLDLYKRDSQSRNIDREKAPDHFGGRVNENFMNPK